MLRKLSAFILFLAFAAVTFSHNLLQLDYQLNTARYAKDCINKYRPALKCNGHCQLMKKLQEKESREQKMPDRKTETSIVIYCPAQPVYSAAVSCSVKAVLPVNHIQSTCQAGHPGNIFQPPRC